MTRDEVIAKAKAVRPDLDDKQLAALADAYLAKKGGTVEVKTETVKVEKPPAKAAPKPTPREPTPAEVAARARTLKFNEEPAPTMVMDETFIGSGPRAMPRLSPEEHAKMMAAVPKPPTMPSRPGGAFPTDTTPGAPPVGTSFPTARRFVTPASAAEVGPATVARAARYVGGGGGRMSEYENAPMTTEDKRKALLDGYSGDPRVDKIKALPPEKVEAMYAAYTAGE